MAEGKYGGPFWKTCVTEALQSYGGTAVLQDIYSWVEASDYLGEDDKVDWEGRGGRPTYKHRIRACIAVMRKSGELERVRPAVYRLVQSETGREGAMADNELMRVKRIMEIGSDDNVGGKDVNRYLADGWKLLHIYSIGYPSEGGPSQRAICVLGWMGEQHLPIARG